MRIKCKFLFRLFLGVFISLFFTSFLSISVSAVDFTVSVEPTGNSYNVGSDLRCTLDYQGQITTVTANRHGECNIPSIGTSSPTYVRNVILNRNIPVTEGNYYSFFFGYQNGDTPVSEVLWNLNTVNDAWTIFQFEEVTSDRMKDICYSWRLSGQTTYECGGLASAENWNSKYFVVTLRANTTGNIMPILGNLDGSPRSFMIVYGGQISMSSIFEFKPGAMESMNEKDDQDRQALDDVSSQTDSDANDSAADAESTGTTLLAAFSSFVSALTSANASNCNIAFNVMYLQGGNVNLCQLSLPPALQVISSLILIGFCVPLSIATARKVIELFRSFQR